MDTNEHKTTTKEEFSAGGVVYKKEGMRMFILVAQHSQHHGWVFPKGLIGDHVLDEGKEETALREVEEETGVKGRILRPLTPVTFWYTMDGIQRKKTVYYFIMEYLGGDFTKHDWEMENVEWIPPHAVAKRLSYESDQQVWQEAEQILLQL